MSFQISKFRRRRSKTSTDFSRKGKKTFYIPWKILLLGGVIWGLVVLFLYSGRILQYTDLLPGQRAPATLVASADFTCIDFSATNLKKAQVAEQVSPVFSIDYAPLSKAERSINMLFDRVLAVHEGTDGKSSLGNSLEIMGIDVSPGKLLAMLSSNHVESSRVALLDALENVWEKGIVDSGKKDAALQQFAGVKNIVLQSRAFPEGKNVRVNNLPSPQKASIKISRETIKKMPELSRHRAVLGQLLERLVQENLFFESVLTEERRLKAEKGIEPIYLSVRAGDTLMEADQLITEQTLAKLQAHQEALVTAQTKRETIRKIMVQAGLLLLSLFIFAGVLYITRPKLLRQFAPVIVTGTLCILILLAAKGLIYLSGRQLLPASAVFLLTPIAIAPLVGIIIYGSCFALPVGIWASLATAITLDNNFMILVQGLFVTVVVALSARDVHKRSNVFFAGVWIGVAKALFAVSLAVLNGQPPEIILSYAAIAFFGGLAIAFSALLLIPIFEYCFKVTTDISLLELSDLSHPLLQRLALEAPGTYHHSLMVANLAQVAAVEVGANDLLVRVCAYYHDIGKLSKPEFFIENINRASNPHDELQPSMSALILVSHVKEGVGLAARYKLPPPIVEGIRQHHGAGLISYFYNRAIDICRKENKSEDEYPKESDYRYPGPRPNSPEMGILLLADSIEAASRSLDKVTSSNIESLVDQIIRERLLDGQLDECGLTLTQLSAIRKNMVFNLNNMLHGRIAYPKDENRNKQPAKKKGNKFGEGKEPDSVDHGTGGAA